MKKISINKEFLFKLFVICFCILMFFNIKFRIRNHQIQERAAFYFCQEFINFYIPILEKIEIKNEYPNSLSTDEIKKRSKAVSQPENYTATMKYFETFLEEGKNNDVIPLDKIYKFCHNLNEHTRYSNTRGGDGIEHYKYYKHQRDFLIALKEKYSEMNRENTSYKSRLQRMQNMIEEYYDEYNYKNNGG